MVSTDVIIQNDVGLHARPAASFVTEAQKFNSVVTMELKGQSTNAKSLLGILALGVGSGAQVTLSAEGEDEILAVEALKKLIENNFGE